MAALFQSADASCAASSASHTACASCKTCGRTSGATAKRLWQEDPLWQPARELIERLLVSYDFGEALVALNVCVKPVLDEVAMRLLAERARRGPDPYLAQLLDALQEDCAWQRAWTAALLTLARNDDAGSERAIRTWTTAWMPLAVRAGDGLLALFEEPGLRVGAVETFATDHLRALDLPDEMHVTNGAAR